MKTFNQYITETVIDKLGERIFFDPFFNSGEQNQQMLSMPISEKMIERLFGQRRFRGYHITSPHLVKKLAKIQNSAKSISTLTSGVDSDFTQGIASGGGVIVELEGNLLFSSYKDVFSNLELEQGRRWVRVDNITNNISASKKIYDYIVKEILKYISKNKIDFFKDGVYYTDDNTYENNLIPWVSFFGKGNFSIEYKDLVNDGWVLHVNGKPATGKDKATAIKFYFDIWENYIKKNSKMFFEMLFSGLDKGKGVGDKRKGISWNEHILNRFKVTHIFLNKPSNLVPLYKEKWKKMFDETKKSFPEAKVTEYNDIYAILNKYVAKRAGLIK